MARPMRCPPAQSLNFRPLPAESLNFRPVPAESLNFRPPAAKPRRPCPYTLQRPDPEPVCARDHEPLRPGQPRDQPTCALPLCDARY
eukprot:3182323-Rhodomonas_salina.1